MKRLWLLVALLLCFTLACAAEEAPTEYVSGDYTYVLLDDGTAEIVSYNGEEAKVILPSELDGHCVTSLGDNAFYWNLKLTHVTLPDSMRNISNNPFMACRKLVDIKVSSNHPVFATVNGVLFNTAEKKLVCYPCGLTEREYSVPQEIITIGKAAFDHCENLENIILPDNLISIGENAFSSCYGLTNITLPDSVINLGSNPFSACDNLTDIRVSPDHPVLATINGVLFHKAEKKLVCYPCALPAQKYTIPQGIRAIGEDAFSYCSNLQSIILPDSVTIIGKDAFYACSSLISIILPESITSIGDSAFSWCNSLKNITLPGSITSIGHEMFFCCSNLTSIILPENITSIGYLAFSYCMHLTDIIIPASVTTIGDNAFSGCDKLTTITVSRGSYAAQYCKDNDLPYTYPDANDWLLN